MGKLYSYFKFVCNETSSSSWSREFAGEGESSSRRGDAHFKKIKMAFLLRALAQNNRVDDLVDRQMNWDLNADSKLDKDEMRGMKRADRAKYLRFLKADKDGDGVLDEDELQTSCKSPKKESVDIKRYLSSEN